MCMSCVLVCPITLMNCCRSHHPLFSLDLHLFHSSSSVLPPSIHLQPSDIFSCWLMLWCCKEQLMFRLFSSWMCVYQIQHINCSSFINMSFLCRWILDIRLIFFSLNAFLKCLLSFSFNSEMDFLKNFSECPHVWSKHGDILGTYCPLLWSSCSPRLLSCCCFGLFIASIIQHKHVKLKWKSCSTLRLHQQWSHTQTQY